ncbi:hypothetical protein [uncultured Subdoligranulum sp.]|uniref:hypothetical protein n=1 Tax=uncultured Subdoligranulum sp. TaxID=512298 RepID=UPI00320A9049
MPDYAYYRETYLGEDIPEEAFPRCIRRAAAELARMRDVYAVAPRPGLDPCEAEAMALCAIADAVYEFDQEDEARGLSGMTVGSVSESYTAPPELCATTLALRAAHYRHEAGYYLQIGRWLPHA